MKENAIDFSDMPRIHELVKNIKINSNSKSYFKFTDEELTCIELKNCLLEQDKYLQELDEIAWTSLKKEVGEKCSSKNNLRGWNQLFELFNEAKGYVFLKELGCQNIEFIARSTNKGIKTPDLKAILDDKKVICEVKTINKSKDKIEAIQNREVTEISSILSDGFFNGLGDTLEKAKKQCLNYCKDPNVQYYIFLVINFDHSFDYINQYFYQVDTFVKSQDLNNFHIEYYNRGKFI